MALAGSGCETPTDPTQVNNSGTANCRSAAATSQTVQVFTTGQTVTTTRTCSFDATLVEVACQLTYTDSVGGPGTGTQTTRWSGLNDLLAEFAVIPPVPRSLSTVIAITPASGGTFTTTATHAYDAQRRLASIVAVSPQSTSTTTYSAWDASQRPTAGSTSLVTPFTSQTFAETNIYDNAQRTIVRVSGVNRCTLTHDQHGNIVSEVCTGTAGSTATTTIGSTLQICR